MVNRLVVKLLAVLADRKGVSSLEYGILAAAIIGALGVVIGSVQTDATTLFGDFKTALDAAVKAAGG